MSEAASLSMRVLIVGIENYIQFEQGKRPGTIGALREIEHRLQEGGWHSRLLVDGATSTNQRSGLSQILEGLEWLHGSEQALLILSGKIVDARFYPADAKSSFLQQSTLAINDLLSGLPKNAGVIIDGPVSAQLVAQNSWALVAQEDEQEQECLFSNYGPTQFLHSITVALNTWPTQTVLKVHDFFNSVQQQDAPRSLYNNYSSLESMTLLTPTDEAINAVTMLTGDTFHPASNTNSENGLSNDDDSSVGESIASQSSISNRGGRFVANGRFQLLRVLGEGGIGQVYLAKDTQLDKKRAVKLLKIPDQLSEEQRTHIRGRMIQSAKAAQELSEFSHHVVQVFDIGIDEETEMPFMVMEYLKGITLNERLYKSPVLNLEQIFSIGLTLCETLAVAHQKKVVHRDLKPDNIMLIERGGTDLFVKLLDFDLVKVESGEVKTQEGQILGTLEYMSPEQLKGQEIDARADVFALGAILYECFSGVRANPGKNQRELVRLLLSDGVKPLRELSPQLPKELCDLIDSCLSLEPEQRPQDAAELAKRLRPLQQYQPALSMMSFGIVSPLLHKQYETPNTLTAQADLSSESLSITDVSSSGSSQNEAHIATRPLLGEETEALQQELKQARSQIEALEQLSTKPASPFKSTKSLLLIALLSGLVLGGVIWWFKQSNTQKQNSVEIEVSNQDDEANSKETQAQPTLTKEPALKALESLMTLPIPSAIWPNEVLATSKEISGLGMSRVYSGGRFAERLSRLVYELNFRWREGDPPRSEWSQHESLRYQLLSRVNLNVLRESSGALYIPESLYIELLGRRPVVGNLTQLGESLEFPDGLLILSSTKKTCKELQTGDFIMDMTWVVRGQKKLNGACEQKQCTQAYERSLKLKRRAQLRLTLNTKRATFKDGLWQIKEMKIKCTL